MKRLGPEGLGSGRLSQSTVWALSRSLPVGGEANQQLAQENVAVQHVGYRMCKGKDVRSAAWLWVSALCISQHGFWFHRHNLVFLKLLPAVCLPQA